MKFKIFLITLFLSPISLSAASLKTFDDYLKIFNDLNSEQKRLLATIEGTQITVGKNDFITTLKDLLNKSGLTQINNEIIKNRIDFACDAEPKIKELQKKIARQKRPQPQRMITEYQENPLVKKIADEIDSLKNPYETKINELLAKKNAILNNQDFQSIDHQFADLINTSYSKLQKVDQRLSVLSDELFRTVEKMRQIDACGAARALPEAFIIPVDSRKYYFYL